MAVETVRELIHEVEKAEADAEKIHEEMNEVPEDVRELVRSWGRFHGWVIYIPDFIEYLSVNMNFGIEGHFKPLYFD